MIEYHEERIDAELGIIEEVREYAAQKESKYNMMKKIMNRYSELDREELEESQRNRGEPQVSMNTCVKVNCDGKKNEICEIMNDPKCMTLVSISNDIDCNVKFNDIDSDVKSNDIDCNVKCDDIDYDVKCRDIDEDVWCDDDDDDVKCDDDTGGEVVEGDRKPVCSLPADLVIYDDYDDIYGDDYLIRDGADYKKLVYSLPVD